MLSRVADSCFWLSRYIERAETSARLLDVNMQLMLDFEHSWGQGEVSLWEPILATLEDRELYRQMHEEIDAKGVLEFVTFERRNPNSIFSCLEKSRENARTVREQISSEMWEQLNGTFLYLRDGQARVDFLESPIDFYRRLVDRFHAFQGTTDATMTHGEGWDFLQAGKFLERADSTSRVLDVKYHILLPSGERVGGNLDVLQWMAVLRSCSAMEAYLKVYRGQVTAWQVAEFLILHGEFPRAIRFSVDSLDEALHRISGCSEDEFSNEAERLSGMLRSELHFESIGGIFERGLHQSLDSMQLRLIKISDAIFEAYCKYQ